MVKEAICFLVASFTFLRLNIFVGGMAGGLNVLLTGGRLGSVFGVGEAFFSLFIAVQVGRICIGMALRC